MSDCELMNLFNEKHLYSILVITTMISLNI